MTTEHVSVPRGVSEAAYWALIEFFGKKTGMIATIDLHPVADAVARAVLSRATPSAPRMVTDAMIAGALFDFLGFLTSRDEPVTFSRSHFAGTAVEVLREWNAKRGLNLDEADVSGWNACREAMLSAQGDAEVK